ncbi:MAG TPA: aromatic amino acid ammonia-lyase [Streptosporangiaceae bacterium]|nr:aromatic amino acid ammonia-lyase [Streptosporangiaceae bacterium]
MTITLNGRDLTVTQVVAAARHGETVALAPEAVAAMRRSRAIVQDVLAGGEPVYGLTTGVGERKAYLLDPAERQRFNHRLVLNHRIAQGDAAPADVVRGAMLCLANSYAKGVTGVRPELAEMIVTLLNEGFAPPVRRLGSIGQGDLGPMADLAHGLITRSGFEVAENEGLALVSSNAFTTAWACLATADAEALLAVFDVAGALDLEAFGANVACLHPVIEQVRPFPGLAATLHQLRLLLAGSYLWQPGSARFLQDPLTFRCLPQIHGAARDALSYVMSILQIELNSSQSNPVVVPATHEPGNEPGNEQGRIVSVGNFDIGHLAAALDFLRIALAPVVTSANERAVKLLQAPYSGLPAGLAAGAGSPDDALAELAVAGQAITVEARTLAHPVSYELASSVKGDGIEDRATMAPLSARRLADMIALSARVVAIELVVAAQAIDLRAPGQLGLGTGRAYRMIRELVPFTQADGTLPADLEPLVELVTMGTLTPAA